MVQEKQMPLRVACFSFAPLYHKMLWNSLEITDIYGNISVTE